MMYQPEKVNKERIELGKAPFTEDEFKEVYRKYMHEHRDEMRYVDAITEHAIALP